MTKPANPKFSVLLPTRNRLDLAIDAIETVRAQSYQDWELILADNCSNDDVAGYVRSLDDSRIVYVRSNVALPVTDNWNRALEAATGEYVVMLGDDDGLVPGYFERCLEVLQELSNPDFLYLGAYHFAFPRVMPGYPQGYLWDVSRRARFLRELEAPELLSEARARGAARAAIGMTATYGFNMQHFLFSREIIQRMQRYGPVFQGPFPDYYAANLAMLIGNRIGLIPEPLVIIGISSKSYGYYHYNKRERDGTAFLGNQKPSHPIPGCLKDSLLPGPQLNSSWLISVALAASATGEHAALTNGIRRYRKLQINRVLCATPEGDESSTRLSTLWSYLSSSERIYAVILEAALLGTRMFPASIRRKLVSMIDLLSGQYLPNPIDWTKPIMSLATFATLVGARFAPLPLGRRMIGLLNWLTGQDWPGPRPFTTPKAAPADSMKGLFLCLAQGDQHKDGAGSQAYRLSSG